MSLSLIPPQLPDHEDAYRRVNEDRANALDQWVCDNEIADKPDVVQEWREVTQNAVNEAYFAGAAAVCAVLGLPVPKYLDPVRTNARIGETIYRLRELLPDDLVQQIKAALPPTSPP